MSRDSACLSSQSACSLRSPSFRNDSLAQNAPGRLRKDGMPDMRFKLNRDYVYKTGSTVELTTSSKTKPKISNGLSTITLASRKPMTGQLSPIDEQLEQTRLDYREEKHYLQQQEAFDIVNKERKRLEEEKLLLEDVRRRLEEQKKLHEAEKEAKQKEDQYLMELYKGLENMQLEVPVVSREEILRVTDDFGTSLGSGGFGEVFKGTWNDSTVAVKVLLPKLCRDPRYFAKLLKRELDSLAKVSHPHIVKLLGFCYNTKITVPAPAIIFSYANAGTLFESIFDGKKSKVLLTPKIVLRVAMDVASALEYLHSCISNGRVLVHRDIKSSNVLLHETNGSVRGILADFGLSRLSSNAHAASGSFESQTSVVGTQGYIDPVYAETYQVLPSMDIYAYGVLLMEMLWKERPEGMLARRVRQTNFGDCVNKAIEIHLGKEKSKYIRVIEELVGIAKNCLVADDVKQRPDAKEIKESLKKLYSRN